MTSPPRMWTLTGRAWGWAPMRTGPTPWGGTCRWWWWWWQWWRRRRKWGCYDDLIACPELAAPPPGTHVPCPPNTHYGCFIKLHYLQILFGLNFICCPFIKHQAKLRLLSHSVPFLYHVSNSKQVRSVIIWGSTSFGTFQARSLKSVLVLPLQIFGLFGPPNKRVNFDKFNQRQKCIFCVLTALYLSK